MSALLEVPRQLPVSVTGSRLGHLSHSSVRLYLQCPERWRRRYIELEYEPSNPNMVIGKTVGAGISAGYVAKLNDHARRDPIESIVLDHASDIFDDTVKHDNIEWGDENKGEIKDTALTCASTYYQRVMVEFAPTTVEEGFSIAYPDADWDLQGYMDITGTHPEISAELHDVKVIAKANSGIDADVQATLYVASRYVRDESLPVFAWHQIKKPTKRNFASVDLMTTTRTPTQINNYLGRIAQVARELDWRAETGNWQGAVPGSWWCSERHCGFWSSCPYGGVR